MSRVAVLGAGTMGCGIAQVFAQAGWTTALSDVSGPALERGLETIQRNLERQVKKATLTPALRDAALGLIRPGTLAEAAADAELVIEAATEDRLTKFKIFQEADRAAPPGAILASNTSSISITAIAGQTRRAPQVIGMHFMNPVPVMQLVEVIRGLDTSDQTTQRVLEIATALGKTPVTVRDAPGFVSNRVLLPMINEAIFCVMEGVATPAILEVLHRDLGDDKYRPAPLLAQMVAAGRLGKKSGRGFYVYRA
jgi:3-hydroxybutyryl-CoA dehydrogenase